MSIWGIDTPVIQISLYLPSRLIVYIFFISSKSHLGENLDGFNFGIDISNIIYLLYVDMCIKIQIQIQIQKGDGYYG